MIVTPTDLLREQPIDPLVERVARGLKPGAYAHLNEARGDLAVCSDLGLEVAPAPIPGLHYDNGPEHAIAYPQVAAEILTRERLPRAEFLGARRTEILRHIGYASIARALVRLHAYNRDDPEYDMVKLPGIPRPEVAWAQGALLGFNPCCIEYYLDTRYRRQPQHPDELDLGFPRTAQRICCPECALRFAEVAQALPRQRGTQPAA